MCLGSENKRPKEPPPSAQKPSASLPPGFHTSTPFQSISFHASYFHPTLFNIFTNGAPDTMCAAARKVHLEAALVVVPKVDVVRAIPGGCPWRPKVSLVALGLLRPPVPARVVGNLSHQVHVPQRLPLEGHLRIMIMFQEYSESPYSSLLLQSFPNIPKIRHTTLSVHCRRSCTC